MNNIWVTLHLCPVYTAYATDISSLQFQHINKMLARCEDAFFSGLNLAQVIA